MNKKNTIEEEIQKTLAQFDNAERLPSNPYFYTRVKQRIDERKKTHRTFFAVLKPATLALLLLINVSTVTWYLNGSTTTSVDTKSELAEILSGDLNLEVEETDLFNIE
ncbi:MAG: hypothetical protein JEY94_13625 [Melioribacteraceae bacterium]|nr:hypothetical protein [Melioribacteraceae bacterium]